MYSEKKLYGPVNNLSRNVDILYGPKDDKGRIVQKLYGSVDGLAKLTYINLGEIPRPGVVTYYTDNTYTTTATARIITQADLDSMASESSSIINWSTTLDGVTISNQMIKEVTLPTWATATPDNFLIGCVRLDTLNYSINLTTLGSGFLLRCDIFNGPLDLSNITSIGDSFLRGCYAFNQPLDISGFNTVGDEFLYGCSSFNQPLDTSNLVNIGNRFLRSCSSFNQPLNLSSAVSIGHSFLGYARSFNQRLEFPNSVTSLGTYFLYNADNMVSPIIFNSPASIAINDDLTFSTDDNTANIYTQGVKLAGLYAQEWKAKFPNRTTSPYRNVGYASIPVLYATEIVENDNAELDIEYGTSVWDINGSYTSGTVELSESVSGGTYNQLESITTTGPHAYTRSNIVGNTEYSYKVQATNSGGEEVESITPFTSKPGLFTVSEGTGQYLTYNTYQQTYTLNLPANGNAYSQTLSYRLKKASESDFGGWININTYSSPSSGSESVLIALETESDYTIEFKSSTPAGERIVSYSQSAIPEHVGPTGVEFTYDDVNASVQNWLSTFSGYSGGNWFIGGQSLPRVTITDPGETTDDAALVQYETFITRPNNGYSSVIAYGPEMTYTFEKESLSDNQVSGITTMMVTAEDSLGAETQFYEGGVYLSWASPTFNGTAQRLSELGALRINFNGSYSGLFIDALNNGDDLNSIKVEYRVTDYAGKIITDWAEVDSEDIRVMPNTGSILNRNYSGSIRIVNFEYTKSVVVDIRASDHFEVAGTIGIPLNLWEEEQKLQPVNYEIEIWDWRTNTYVADLSTLIVGDLNLDWELNDVEEIDFSIDLVQFEERCKDMGVEPKEILTPYKHDIRIRRNGKYILGCQLVEANIQVPNNSPVLINIKCTGFLNLFKDQYILNEAWSGYTYAQIARKLIQTAQKPDCLIKNPTGDIDTSYWLAANGTVASSTASYSGDRCIMGSRTGTGWITLGTQMEVDSGESIVIDAWIKGQNGVICQVRERKYVTQASDQKVIANIALDGNWQHIQVPYTTFWQDGYVIIEMNRTNSSTNLYIDDCYVYAQNDDYALCDLKVPLGVDTASNVQNNSRQVNYELQNIKDAIIDLTNMEEDNFDFDFSYDRTFNCYNKKGSEKLGVEVVYPGNVESLNINRSATNLANKIYRIGSGIGDERLQVDVNNNSSRQTYGTRESIVTDSNVTLEGTLLAQAIGDLYDRKDPTNLPQVTVRDGSINPDIVQVGDYIPVSIQGDNYLSTINDIYRVVKVSLSVNENAVETMRLTLEPPVKRPEKKMVRYIRDSLAGCDRDLSKQWNEIQALVLIGNEFVNVAQGATVYGSRAFSSGHGGNLVTDGKTNTYADMTAQLSRDAITIDLGAEYPVDYIKIWHYYQDGRAMRGEHLSVGTTLPDSVDGIADLETLLWAYDGNNGYVETSEGRRSGWLQEDKVVDKTETDSRHMIRFIRESHIGSSANNSNVWAEFDARLLMGTQYNDTVKKGVKMFYSDAVLAGNGIRAIVDGEPSTFTSSGTERPKTRKSATIDLGGLYPIDLVKIFHYTGDNRTFYGSRLSVGKELPGEANGTEDLETILWADEDTSGIAETSTGRQSPWIQSLPNNVEIETPTMARYIKDTFTSNSGSNPNRHAWYRFEVYIRDPETGALRDIAMGKIPTFTGTVTNPSCATDDIQDTCAIVDDAGPQSAVIDLGAEYPIDYIRIKHFGDERTSYGDILSFGTELTEGNTPLENIVWNDGETIGYIEKTNGRWSGWIQDNPQREFYTGNRRPIRYIRDYIAGNSVSGNNHWVEIEAHIYENEEWKNVALGKTVTCSFTPTESGHTNPQVVTDGNVASTNYLTQLGNNTPGAVTVDLGQEYYIDYIRVRHYYADNRVYNTPVLSAGTTLPDNDDQIQPLEWVLNNESYMERDSGIVPKWIQGEL